MKLEAARRAGNFLLEVLPESGIFLEKAWSLRELQCIPHKLLSEFESKLFISGTPNTEYVIEQLVQPGLVFEPVQIDRDLALPNTTPIPYPRDEYR